MCGRYSQSADAGDLAEEFEVDRIDVRERLEPDYNVAPTKETYAVLERRRRDEHGERTDDPPERRLRTLRWGLVPSWAKDPSIGARMINARMETVQEKPAFRKAFAERRCLVPADGYYEWYGETKGRKQPFFIHPRGGGGIAMAGLYEIWRDRSRAEEDPDRFWWTLTILTTTAEDAVGRIHDRMPFLVEPAAYRSWLDPRRHDPDELRELLVPAAPGRLDAHPVSTEVNKADNNGPRLIEPIPAEPPESAADREQPTLFD